jgi:hypothetical protein
LAIGEIAAMWMRIEPIPYRNGFFQKFWALTNVISTTESSVTCLFRGLKRTPAFNFHLKIDIMYCLN